MQDRTLCILIKENSKKVLLGMKKRGFGQGKWNGFGGKLKENETIEEAAIRELFEEAGVRTGIEDLKKIGELNFVFPSRIEWNQKVHVYFVKKWEGEPKESEEMKPKWFNFDEIPLDSMWDADKYWVPLVLKNKKLEGEFFFDSDNETIKKYNIKEV